MFTKNSRYYALDNIVVNNSRHRQINAKSIRRIPDTPSTFEHTLDENDRLDLLGEKYYSQPLKWWRICDANPEYASPLDMLGKGALVTYRFSVMDNDIAAPFPWLSVMTPLADQIGVDAYIHHDHVVGEREEIVQEMGQDVIVTREVYMRFLDVTINSALITIDMVVSLLTTSENYFSAPEKLGRVGKKIHIPPVR